MRLRQTVVPRVQRVLPRQIEATGMLPVVSSAQWQNSALVALPLPHSVEGRLALRMHAHTVSSLISEGLEFLAAARLSRGALPGMSHHGLYQPWRRIAGANAASVQQLLRCPPHSDDPGMAGGAGFFTCSVDGRFFLWLLPESAQIWLSWNDRASAVMSQPGVVGAT